MEGYSCVERNKFVGAKTEKSKFSRYSSKYIHIITIVQFVN